MSEREHRRGCRVAGAPPSAVLVVDAGSDPAELSALAANLSEALPERWRVFTGGAGGPRDIATAVDRILALGCLELVVVPAQPQFCQSVTGRLLQALYGALAEHDHALELAVHASWHDDAGYVSALARRIAEHASAHGVRPGDTDLTFVVPSPGARADTDPYYREARRTAEMVAQRVGWPTPRVTVVGTHEALRNGAALVCPLGPLGPLGPVETVSGLRWPSLISFPPFIAALKRIVLKGPRPVSRGRKAPAPLLPTALPGRTPGAPATLVSVSASLAGVLGRGRGPELRFSAPRAFAQVKKPHTWLRDFLDWAREATSLREAFLWNTCQRMEFYGWLPGAVDGPGGERLLARIRKELFGTEPEGLEVNILDGLDARHHLLRTACGLNSDLPGDRDVVAQLQTACRRAQGAGTAGELSRELVSTAAALAEDVTTRTHFGRFATGYCTAALARIREAGDRDLGVLHHVVIGGSTTSRSVLCALRSQHGVPEHQLTSVYRDHHGQMKQLRAAVGNGKRLRVHAYSEECVLRAVADADVVYFGIDQSEPVIEAGVLEGLRDYTARPLTVVDFNSFGSLAAPPATPGISMWTAQALDDEVAMHAAITTTREGFGPAVEEAEAWIEAHLATSESPAGRPAAV